VTLPLMPGLTTTFRPLMSGEQAEDVLQVAVFEVEAIGWPV
jgi:hypothetical protein